ncbi:MAG: hypothetical protein CMH98_17345 [Oceanospirillaceae bacterium]|nr:hypothetical protein [Oceanospirillaceae bacterium]
MTFYRLPNDLKNIVCGFAWKSSWEETQSSLDMCVTVKDYQISPVFLRRDMWSWTFASFLPNPMVEFMPIQKFTGRWHDLIDWHAVNELLFRLDYRRKVVRMAGTRAEWFRRFKQNWLQIALFDTFYRVLLHSDMDVFKPTFTRLRYDQLSVQGPFFSARWLVDDYASWGSN